jgi:exodeoxyribonuclease VII large subunit
VSPRRRPSAPADFELFPELNPPPAPVASAESGTSYERRAKRERSSKLAAAAEVAAAQVSEPSYEEEVPGGSAQAAVSVSTLTRTAKDVLEGAFLPLWVRGEVTDFKAHRNGHWYFCLRDHAAQIRCVVWARDQRHIPAPPDEGMQVSALAQLTVYAARGDMQLSVKAMEAEGDGLRRKALERMLQRLEADGLLDPTRKRPLPRFPRTVAVITSPDGAALHDVAAVVRRRCATVELVLVPAKVQGDGAAEELCAALDRVRRWGGADVVIIGRGGGARDDLWAFNDEALARAVAACPVPIVSAVGHEIDVTLCDLVADLRAPTPSAAAEAVVPVLDDLRAELRDLGRQMTGIVSRRVAEARAGLRGVSGLLALSANRLVDARRARLGLAAGKLDALSPLATLARGYAVPRAPDGTALGSVHDFDEGAPFDLLVRDGVVRAVTESVRRRHLSARVPQGPGR